MVWRLHWMNTENGFRHIAMNINQIDINIEDDNRPWPWPCSSRACGEKRVTNEQQQLFWHKHEEINQNVSIATTKKKSVYACVDKLMMRKIKMMEIRRILRKFIQHFESMDFTDKKKLFKWDIIHWVFFYIKNFCDKLVIDFLLAFDSLYLINFFLRSFCERNFR